MKEPKNGNTNQSWVNCIVTANWCAVIQPSDFQSFVNLTNVFTFKDETKASVLHNPVIK